MNVILTVQVILVPAHREREVQGIQDVSVGWWVASKTSDRELRGASYRGCLTSKSSKLWTAKTRSVLWGKDCALKPWPRFTEPHTNEQQLWIMVAARGSKVMEKFPSFLRPQVVYSQTVAVTLQQRSAAHVGSSKTRWRHSAQIRFFQYNYFL